MPNNRQLTIAPNRPVTLALQDPEGRFDFETGMGMYETTTGELVTLPRPAVVLLNQLDPGPGEEIVITKHWSGKRGQKAEWTISLSSRSENCRAKAEKDGQEPAEGLKTVQTPTQTQKTPVAPPTPIRRPPKRQIVPEVQPRLFDRGTGTHGPLPAGEPENLPRFPAPLILPVAAIGRRKIEGQIPANVAMREILTFIKADTNTANWDAQSIQDLASTCYIAAVKQGWITVWERPQ